MSDAYVAHTAGERLVNSDGFDGMAADEGGKAIVEKLAAAGKAEPKVTYRLRDWLISRQRYWGTPIPIVYCPVDGIVPVPDADLPVRCPRPSTTRAAATTRSTTTWRSATRPARSAAARRGARPTRWTRSSIRRGTGSATCRRTTTTGPVDLALVDDWTPVDQYTGGAEHAVMHLLYSRFLTKAMRDIGLVEQNEPFLRLFNQGQILGADGERMWKSRGNVQDPDDAGRSATAPTRSGCS